MACCGAGQTKPPWPLSSAVKASPKNQLRPGKWLRNRWNLACDTPARAPSETSSPYVSMMSQIRIRWPHFDIDVPRLESHNVAPPPRNLPRPRTRCKSALHHPITLDQSVHFLVVGWTWNARFTKPSAERAPLQPVVHPKYTRWIPMIQPAPLQIPHDMLPKLRIKIPDSKTLDSEPGLSP